MTVGGRADSNRHVVRHAAQRVRTIGSGHCRHATSGVYQSGGLGGPFGPGRCDDGSGKRSAVVGISRDAENDAGRCRLRARTHHRSEPGR